MPTQEEIDAANRMALAAHQRDMNGLIEAGRHRFGATTFDEASEVVARSFGDKVGEFGVTLKGFDKAPEIVAHLANLTEDERKRIAALPPSRRLVECARIEARMSSHGVPPSTGHAPAWTGEAARSGNISLDDWKRTGGDELNDRDWHKAFDRFQSERSRRR
jgi:hypothetical protein